jgi:hypothetical protein
VILAGHRGPRPAGQERGGIFFNLLVFLVVVAAFAALAWMLFLPAVVTAQLRARTGFDVSLRSLAVNPFAGTIALRGLVLANPAGFPRRDFLELREFRADADLGTLFSDRMVFDSMTIDVAALTLVTRADGATNAAALQRNLRPPASPGGPSGRQAPARAGRPFLIRRLTLRFDRLVVANFAGSRPEVHEFDLALDHTYPNVTDVRSLFPPDARQQLAPLGAAIEGLASGDVGRALGDAARAAAQSAGALLHEAGQKTGEKVKGLFDGLEESKKP